MQVNKIDNTNFGMALKIDKGLKSELKTKPAEFLKTLDNLGEKVADVSMYHVVFEEGKGFTTPTIRCVKKGSVSDCFADLKAEERNLGKYYEFPSGMLGDTVSGFYPNEPYAFKKLYGKDAAKKYKEFKALDTYSQAAEYSRMLEQLELKRMTQEAKANSEKKFKETIQRMQQEQHERAIDELLNKYENDTIPETKVQKTESKGFWNVLKNFFK